MDIDSLLLKLINRKPDTHKGNYGRVGVVAGSKSMLGAAQLTSFSSLKMGSGLVYLYSIKHAKKFIRKHPELIIHTCLNDEGYCDINYLYSLIKKDKCNVVAVGPGLGISRYTKKMVVDLIIFLSQQKIDGVIDADALNVLTDFDWSIVNSNCFVLTPHVGEFKRVFSSLSYDESITTRKLIAKKAAKISNQIVVLKGHNTVVSNGDEVYVNSTGNPSMATAGSGDVLTGIISSLIGQGFNSYEAACLGVYLHGSAGDKAHNVLSISVTASDIIEYLQYVLS